MWIWSFRRVDSAVFVFCAKFGSNICYSHWDRRTYALDVHLLTSRKLTSGFGFWSCGYLRRPWCIFLHNLLQDIIIQSKVIDIFPKLRMATAAILDFHFMWIWPFWRVDSAVFVFCAKFGSNICYSHWDRRTYASDIYLMTSLDGSTPECAQVCRNPAKSVPCRKAIWNANGGFVSVLLTHLFYFMSVCFCSVNDFSATRGPIHAIFCTRA